MITKIEKIKVRKSFIYIYIYIYIYIFIYREKKKIKKKLIQKIPRHDFLDGITNLQALWVRSKFVGKMLFRMFV
jgi:hypothetical protein